MALHRYIHIVDQRIHRITIVSLLSILFILALMSWITHHTYLLSHLYLYQPNCVTYRLRFIVQHFLFSHRTSCRAALSYLLCMLQTCHWWNYSIVLQKCFHCSVGAAGFASPLDLQNQGVLVRWYYTWKYEYMQEQLPISPVISETIYASMYYTTLWVCSSWFY